MLRIARQQQGVDPVLRRFASIRKSAKLCLNVRAVAALHGCAQIAFHGPVDVAAMDFGGVRAWLTQ